MAFTSSTHTATATPGAASTTFTGVGHLCGIEIILSAADTVTISDGTGTIWILNVPGTDPVFRDFADNGIAVLGTLTVTAAAGASQTITNVSIRYKSRRQALASPAIGGDIET